ncbi:hypothetical protein [Sphingomonas quercus]|uniref:Uncharacterized protein n=1 Tax=Sphingomonas quercus TaxID=2842451 RepID=A0ABS6BEW7_9SPHN|nr:hypothetical protein [Sphingomonas quercus]MBU3076847.1 hypothetical protein [Sphingomonas quercus]
MRATPEERAHAWARYRRLMRWMALVAALVVAAVLVWLKASGTPMPLPMVIATIAGVGLSMLLGTALMGLVFLSAGSGHDDIVGEIAPEEEEDWDRKAPRR